MSLPRSSRAAFFIAVIALCSAGEGRAADLLSQVASFLGISATPNQMKAPDATNKGDIWVIDAAGGARTQLTTGGGYLWPVFDPGASRIVALKAGEVWEIPLAGVRPGPRAPRASTSKLVVCARHRAA